MSEGHSLRRRRSDSIRRPRSSVPSFEETKNAASQLESSRIAGNSGKESSSKLSESLRDEDVTTSDNPEQRSRKHVRKKATVKDSLAQEEARKGQALRNNPAKSNPGSGLKSLKLKIGGVSLGPRTVPVDQQAAVQTLRSEEKEHAISRSSTQNTLDEDMSDDADLPDSDVKPNSSDPTSSNFESEEKNEGQGKKKRSITFETEEEPSEDEDPMNNLNEEPMNDEEIENEVDESAFFLSGKMTARQRAMTAQETEISVEFPEGLIQKPIRKLSVEDSEAEKLLKREEAARKRKQQSEKAARENQAMVIQKILGQDSSRKRREGKVQKQRLEAEKEKEASEREVAKNSIRYIQNEKGAIVSFSEDLDFPECFNLKLKYPGPRESCSGPHCSNPFKYRDSKSNVPLCSLECYKAVRDKTAKGKRARS